MLSLECNSNLNIMHLKEGTILCGGTYKVVRFIKSGGFGCTYEAMHMVSGKRVAIKEFFVKDFCNRDEETGSISVGTRSKVALVDRLRKKFVDEASALSSLNHVGIVDVFSLFFENETAYYVMAYIDGCSLDEYIRNHGPLDEEVALNYIRQVCDALEYVHKKNILHLDIKPGNLMLDVDGRVKLIDFGTAKQYDESEGENTSTLLGSTPGYAPPEQGNTKVTTFSAATDIYSLGATFYKLLTGITPPTANERSSGEEMDPLPANVSKETSDAIMKAMVLNRKGRLQSVEEFLVLLPSKVESISVGQDETVINSGLCPDDAEETEVFQKPEDSEKIETVFEQEQRQIPVPIRKPKRRRWLWLVLLLVIIAGAGGYVLMSVSRASKDSVQESIHQGHRYVDLGLPSGILWAECNLGAEEPEECGRYYKFVIDADEDYAQKEWGGDWRMPVAEEFGELVKHCQWKMDTRKGLRGYEIIGPNGNSIFLPAAGFRYFSDDYNYDDGFDLYGLYGCDVSLGNGINYSLQFSVDEDLFGVDLIDYSVGLSIRPVLTPSKKNSSEIYYSAGELHCNGVSYPMVYVLGGDFTMGNDDITNQSPAHLVSLSSYSIGQYEVTQELWEAVMDDNPSCSKGKRRPVDNVSWDDCMKFIEKLNSLTGMNFRLPTEAQWEYAARGPYWEEFSGSDDVNDVAIYDETSSGASAAVGTRESNFWGIYDMSGNVSEWCSDKYGKYESDKQTDPQGATSGRSYIHRGGSWKSDERYCKVTWRAYKSPDIHSDDVGFRLCL